ncbi:MAG: ADP-ribosylglycohydrolase family protein, partial [Ignavibacteriales bacterium]|nr:ADP-ribosylglycohydrolase family protein [Ignavibacteriales bacterium]
HEVEDMDFKYTTYSLNDVYSVGYKHALEMIKKNGGSENNELVTITYQTPKPVRFEKSFEGMVPVARKWGGWAGTVLKDSVVHNFEGNGVVVTGSYSEMNDKITFTNYVFKLEVDLDGKKDTISLPYNFKTRHTEMFSKYQLPLGKHQLKLKLLNPDPIANVIINDVIVYSDKPATSVVKQMSYKK